MTLIHVEVDEALAAKLDAEPTVRGLSMDAALVMLAKRALHSLDQERSPHVFTAKCMARIEQFEIGRKFRFIDAVPPHTSYCSQDLKALAAAIRNSPLVKAHPPEEIDAPGMPLRPISLLERIQPTE